MNTYGTVMGFSEMRRLPPDPKYMDGIPIEAKIK